ncbi:chloramphenicol efflux pump [Actinorhabdospora filicis]|uniref:Chloramphenicol efflux pump n=1 Tax=Actinorhabdospora filicis TaxID=1785913 RepID=A0A9W6SI50_9ACTN|nr:Cmx/CmrA family chloramphenicol efflux MFS transporter [Actinorhabdospora filicis]GLZ76423.1 chloramphenicol efflux pump [Actinorhabdospora filicis]
MPLAVYLLGLAVFAMGTSEFMLAGILPGIAEDLSVSVPDAGLLISAFAIGMLVGAPALALATIRLPRRAALTGFLAVFAAAHVLGALVTSYPLLFATRAIAALSAAGLVAVATVAAMAMVEERLRPRAVAVVVGGLTIANIAGVPLGTLIGQHLGWRAAFWAVAALSVLALTGVAATVPGGRGAGVPSMRAELRAMASPRLWLTYGTTALASGAVIITFGYLSGLLTDVTGVPAAWVPAVLAVFGLGAFIGITTGGRTASAHPRATPLAGGAVIVLASLALATGAAHTWAVVPAVFALGVGGFLISPPLNVRAYALAGEARTLAGGTVIAAYNLGNTAAPWLGGLLLTAGLGHPSTAWAGAALAGLSLLGMAAGFALDGRVATMGDAERVRALSGRPVV